MGRLSHCGHGDDDGRIAKCIIDAHEGALRF